MDERLVADIRRYFEQQRELYGDTIYVDKIPEFGAIMAKKGSQQTETSSEQASTASDSVAVDWKDSSSLEILHEKIHGCLRCPLGATRNKFVFGVGNPKADIVLVGEAPGAEEDKQGEPFVGRAGKLLNDILKAIDLEREEVYICNILKCRPPGNRDPLPAEVEQCEPYLHKQLEIMKPKIMLALGRVAAQTLLRTKKSLTQMRAEKHEYQGIPLVVTYHPAALLRNPNWKRPTWEDVQKFRTMYDELTGKKK